MDARPRGDSPCINVCMLDAAAQSCLGCGRTLGEIEHWLEFTPAQRAAIMAELPVRLACFEAQRVAQAAGRIRDPGTP